MAAATWQPGSEEAASASISNHQYKRQLSSLKIRKLKPCQHASGINIIERQGESEERKKRAKVAKRNEISWRGVKPSWLKLKRNKAETAVSKAGI